MKKNLQKPFFSNFLENQLDKKAENQVQGGTDDPPIHTMSLADSPQTQKYPSDSDEYTKPAADMAQTQKYPSDGDDDPIVVEM
jgi:hypothetical protein